MNQLAEKEHNLPVVLPDRELEPLRKTAARSRKQVNFKLSKSKLPMLVIALLLVYVAVTFTSQFGSLASMQRDLAAIEQEIQEIKQKNEVLRSDLRDAQSAAFIEEVAREQLGLVKTGETRIVAVPEGTELKKINSPTDSNTVNH